MLSVFLAGLVNFFSDLLLCTVLKLGLTGAAWATLFSQYCACALLLRVLAKRGYLNLSKIIPTSPLLDLSEERRAVLDTAFRILSFFPFLFVMLMKMTMHNSAAASAATLGGPYLLSNGTVFCFSI